MNVNIEERADGIFTNICKHLVDSVNNFSDQLLKTMTTDFTYNENNHSLNITIIWRKSKVQLLSII